MSRLPRLPTGIQTFSKIRGDDYVYVDKTELLRRLVTSAGAVFLSRPRRFGKSLLVDEWDKPILDNLEDPELARELRDGLRDLYSVLKDSDEFLRFVFLAGVPKFSKVSLFSGLNHLEDITFSPVYAAICGYTQGDVEREFAIMQYGFRLLPIHPVTSHGEATGGALAQIEEKDDAAKHRRPGVTVYCVGVEFDKESRNIVGFAWRQDEGSRP